MKILVDADSCPVIGAVERIARENSVPCMLICDSAHVLKSDYCSVTVTDTAPDSVDILLVNSVEAGDIVVTQDYGLAAMSLAKGAAALNQNGLVYSKDNIDSLLLARHIGKKARRAGIRTSGPKKRTERQNADFEAALGKMIKA